MSNSIPFRWNIQKREQLGTLIEDVQKPVRLTDDFLDDLRDVCARVLAFSDGADLAFIGRSPENLFDYLSGIFADIDERPRLHLVQFSLRYVEDGVDQLPPAQLNGLAKYFEAEGIDPAAIAVSRAPLALVDFIAYGGTMKNLVSVLKWQADQLGTDWNAVQRRLKIIGLTTRTKNSPNTWRWHQNQDWLDLAPDMEIANVSAGGGFTFGIANSYTKVTKSHHKGRWADAHQQSHRPSEEQVRALDFAARLYDLGREKTERRALARKIAATDRMKLTSIRQLVLNLKR